MIEWTDNLKQALDKIQYEPNYETFVYKGYRCIVRRLVYLHSFFGCVNGYVLVPKGHKFWDKRDFLEEKISCHGGITWSSESEELFPDMKNSWCYGFDTNHYLDLAPFMAITNSYLMGRASSVMADGESTYKDWNYVKKECMSIVDQMIELEKTDKIST